MEAAASDRETVNVKVLKTEKIKLRRVRKTFELREKNLVLGINLELDQAQTDQYRLIHTEQEGLPLRGISKRKSRTEDITSIREKRQFSRLTLVAEISRYLNKSPLFIENVLEQTQDGMAAILRAVNEFNELLYDWIIPRLFKDFYDIAHSETTEEYEVELVKLSKDGYNVSAKRDLIVSHDSARERVSARAEKSFHLDKYCFDSNPEKVLFWDLLREGRVKQLFFTGMLTHGQSDFFVQYIDPTSHTVRSYYPDFLLQREDNVYVMVEVKGDHMIDDPVVQAKKEFAEQMASANGMTYRLLKGSEAEKGQYSSLLI